MSLITVSRAEKWNSSIPVSEAIRAMFFSFTPQPASRMSVRQLVSGVLLIKESRLLRLLVVRKSVCGYSLIL